MKRLALLIAAACLLALPVRAQMPLKPVTGAQGIADLEQIINQNIVAAINAATATGLCQPSLRGSSVAVNVLDCGALADGATDNAPAFQNAVNATQTVKGAGSIYIPPGHFCIKSPITVTNNDVKIFGISHAAFIDACGADTQMFILNGQRDQLEGLTIAGSKNLSTTKNAVTLGSNASTSRVIDNVISGGAAALLNNSQGSHITYNKISESYGTALVIARGITGVNQGAGGGGYYIGDQIDQNYPGGTPANASQNPAAWAAATSYSKGAIVSTQGFYIQAVTAGTSGASAPTLLPYETNIPDGSAVWQLLAPTTYYGFLADTGASAVTIDYLDLTGPYTDSLHFDNTLATTVVPQSTVATNTNFQSFFRAGVYFVAGAGIEISGGNVITGCVGNSTLVAGGCTGVWLNAAGGNTVYNTRIIHNTIYQCPNGVQINGQSAGIIVAGNAIQAASTAAVNVSSTSLANFTIDGNDLSNDGFWAVNAIAVFVNSNVSTAYMIVNNLVHGASTGVSDSGTGTPSKTVTGNN